MKKEVLKFISVVAAMLITNLSMPVSAVIDSESEKVNSEDLAVEMQNVEIVGVNWSINDIIMLKNYLLGDDGVALSDEFDVYQDNAINVFDYIAMKRSSVDYIMNSDVLAEGDGWYIKGSTLYISKIYYGVLNLSGNDKYVCDTPWTLSEYYEQVTSVIVDGEMVYKLYPNSNSADPDTDEAVMYNGLFGDENNLESIIFKRLDLDKIKDLSNWFAHCTLLKSVDLSGIDTSKVLSFDSMFAYCTALTSINLNCIDTSAAKSMSSMFRGCESLSKLYVEKCNVDNVDNFSNMFQDCLKLVNVNLSGWNFVNDNASAIFSNCNAIENIDIGSVYYNYDPDIDMSKVIGYSGMNIDSDAIKSFMFAEDWEIDWEKSNFHVPFTADDEHIAGPIMLGKNTLLYEVIVYEQLVPEWYEEYNVVLDGTMILDTDYVDIYLSIADDYSSEPDVKDTLEAIADMILEASSNADSEILSKLSEAIMEKKENDEWADLIISEIEYYTENKKLVL